MNNPNNPFACFIRGGRVAPLNPEKYLLQRHWARVKQVSRGIVVPPLEVEIQSARNCNFNCRHCLGRDSLDKYRLSPLPDRLRRPENMLKAVEGIVNYRQGEFRVEAVRFSGFTGEPLVAKAATLAGMRRLIDERVRVGLFTNGYLLDETTWETVAGADYVHLSLDAGDSATFNYLKGSRRKSPNLFEKVLANLGGLAQYRSRSSLGTVQISVGYIITSDNYQQIYGLAGRVKELGANVLRTKVDLSGRSLLNEEEAAATKEQLRQIEADLCDDNFQLVQSLVPGDEIAGRSFSRCLSQALYATVGSDGNVYPCDHLTLPGVPFYGNAISRPLSEIWTGPLRARMLAGLPEICPAGCPPLAARVNPFLLAIRETLMRQGKAAAEDYRAEITGIRRDTRSLPPL